MMTLLVPPFKWSPAFSKVVKTSVDYTTYLAPVFLIWSWLNLAPGRWWSIFHWWQASHSQPCLCLWTWHEENSTEICRPCSWGQWMGTLIVTISALSELKAALVNRHPVPPNLFTLTFTTVSQGCSWHCAERCGCLMNRKSRELDIINSKS